MKRKSPEAKYFDEGYRAGRLGLIQELLCFIKDEMNCKAKVSSDMQCVIFQEQLNYLKRITK